MGRVAWGHWEERRDGSRLPLNPILLLAPESPTQVTQICTDGAGTDLSNPIGAAWFLLRSPRTNSLAPWDTGYAVASTAIIGLSCYLQSGKEQRHVFKGVADKVGFKNGTEGSQKPPADASWEAVPRQGQAKDQDGTLRKCLVHNVSWDFQPDLLGNLIALLQTDAANPRDARVSLRIAAALS